jgi:hypothetical protein
MAGSSCRSSEVSVGKSHLQEKAKLNAYADVKLAVPVSDETGENKQSTDRALMK